MTAFSATRQRGGPDNGLSADHGGSQPAPRVAVIVASRHGATVGIAEAIRSQLTSAGLRARLFVAEDFGTFEGVDAVVLGSAVYAGHWMKSAQALLDQHRSELSELPVWLFSSGPVGDEPTAGAELPPAVVRAADAIGARDHKLFAGKLDPEALGFTERTLVRALHAPHGDFRDWDAIETWAEGIGQQLVTDAVPGAPGGPYIQSRTTT